MACTVCFFSNTYQNLLKCRSFGSDSFEKKLLDYKSFYLSELKNLKSIKDCKCTFYKEGDVYIKWTDGFLRNLQSNMKTVEDTFDALIKIYYNYISKSNKDALESIWQFLEYNSLLKEEASPLLANRLLFRARIKKEKLNKDDILEYFHIPFNKRRSVKNQRFSISGQPMLYLSSSVFAVEKEMELDVNKLCIAAFLPHKIIHKKFYQVHNPIYDVIVRVLPVVCAAGSKIDYFNDDVAPNHKTIIPDIKKSILFQILTFPTHKKGTFIEEYVLPQMLTTALLNHKFNGIVFNSTKNYADISNADIQAEYDLNVAFFVNYYVFTKKYDEDLLDSFIYFLPEKRQLLRLIIEKIIESTRQVVHYISRNKSNRQERVESINEKIMDVLCLSGQKGNVYNAPLANAKIYLENLQTAKIKGRNYFDTNEGRLELEFYHRMVDELEQRLKKS